MALPPRRGFGKLLLAPLLVFNFAATIVFLGLAAWLANLIIDNLNLLLQGLYDTQANTQDLFDVFEGSAANPLILLAALIAGVVTVTSYIVGLHHVRVWTTPSATAAQSAAWIAFGLLMLPFALVWREIALGAQPSDKALVVEAFVIIVTVVHLAYTLLLYVPDRG